MLPETIPAALKALARHARFDPAKSAPSMEEFDYDIVQQLDPRDPAALRPVLQKILAGDVSAPELSEFWAKLPSSLYIEDGDKVRAFLVAVLARLEN